MISTDTQNLMYSGPWHFFLQCQRSYHAAGTFFLFWDQHMLIHQCMVASSTLDTIHMDLLNSTCFLFLLFFRAVGKPMIVINIFLSTSMLYFLCPFSFTQIQAEKEKKQSLGRESECMVLQLRSPHYQSVSVQLGQLAIISGQKFGAFSWEH